MRSITAITLFGLLVAPAVGDWPHDIKWDQLEGLDTYGAASWIDTDTPSDALTADDYWCDGTAGTRFISDIEFWGWSYYGIDYLDQFRITFWDDVPATPQDASHPGNLLYEFSVAEADPADPLHIGWQELEAEHFKINLPEANWFDQGLHEGRVLWIGIQGVMVQDGFFDAFYWQFRERHLPTWGDDAAFASEYFATPPWSNWGSGPGFGDPALYEGPLPEGWTSLDMSFRLTAIPEPVSLVLLAAGVLALRRR